MIYFSLTIGPRPMLTIPQDLLPTTAGQEKEHGDGQAKPRASSKPQLLPSSTKGASLNRHAPPPASDSRNGQRRSEVLATSWFSKPANGVRGGTQGERHEATLGSSTCGLVADCVITLASIQLGGLDAVGRSMMRARTHR